MKKTEEKRILFFIGSLRSGGKERRLIELLTYLKGRTGFKLMLVVTKDQMHYPAFKNLNIPYLVLAKKMSKYDLSVFYQFVKVCRSFNPDLIHTWGRIQTLYALPGVITQRVPLINSQITSAPPTLKKWSFDSLVDRVNFYCSRIVLSNSQAGIESYNPPQTKARVIYNGLNMSRFVDLPSEAAVRQKYSIETPFVVLMSASFTPNKNYELFCNVAEQVTSLRKDITFIGIGDTGRDDAIYKKLLLRTMNNPRILLPGMVNDVEALVNICTIGLLFSNNCVHGEGISNSILEYMALGKPVIANNSGGTKEIVVNGKNGYLVTNETEEEISTMIIKLIDDEKKRHNFGEISKTIIRETFSLQRMGKAFEEVYIEALN